MRIAFATDLNEGLSSLLRTVDSCLANVEDSHFLTSSGTASDWSSDRSSGASSLFDNCKNNILKILEHRSLFIHNYTCFFVIWALIYFILQFHSRYFYTSKMHSCFCPFIHILLLKGVISLKLLGKHIHRNTMYGNRCFGIWTYMKINLYLVLRKFNKKCFLNRIICEQWIL